MPPSLAQIDSTVAKSIRTDKWKEDMTGLMRLSFCTCAKAFKKQKMGTSAAAADIFDVNASLFRCVEPGVCEEGVNAPAPNASIFGVSSQRPLFCVEGADFVAFSSPDFALSTNSFSTFSWKKCVNEHSVTNIFRSVFYKIKLLCHDATYRFVSQHLFFHDLGI